MDTSHLGSSELVLDASEFVLDTLQKQTFVICPDIGPVQSLSLTPLRNRHLCSLPILFSIPVQFWTSSLPTLLQSVLSIVFPHQNTSHYSVQCFTLRFTQGNFPLLCHDALCSKTTTSDFSFLSTASLVLNGQTTLLLLFPYLRRRLSTPFLLTLLDKRSSEDGSPLLLPVCPTDFQQSEQFPTARRRLLFFCFPLSQ